MIKLLFFGSNTFPTPILAKCRDSKKIDVVGLVTSPHSENNGDDVFHYAKKHNIKTYQPKKIKESGYEILKQSNPDIILVANYGLLLPKYIIDYPQYKCINVHASLLPLLRGACPIEMAILQDFKETGISIQIMELSLDTGDILFQKLVQISENETGGSLTKKLQNITEENIISVILDWTQDKIQPRKQDNSIATYCHRRDISKEKARIKWTESAEEIERNIRAFNPRIVSWTEYNTGRLKKRMKIFKARIIKRELDKKPGFTKTEGGELLVQCGSGVLSLQKIQPEGKKVMDSKQFVNGLKDKITFI
jgi:methionyl-tRNA formyltransferase